MSTERPAQNAEVIFWGPFPPPVHGQSAATLALAQELEELGIGIVRRNLAGSTFQRVLLHAAAAMEIVTTSAKACYFSLNSNSGMWLTAALVALAEAKGKATFVHHHAYAHIAHKRKSMDWLVRMAPRATHILLGERMASDLTRTYPQIGRTVIVNNAGLIDPNLSHIERTQATGPLRLGHLSNLTRAKGVEAAVDLAIAALENGLNVTLSIAGPKSDADAAAAIDRAERALGERFRYWGPVYDETKREFFEAIDVFVFPSLYVNEAEPLVILEALASGIPSIAYDIGCIAGDLADVGTVIAPGAPFTAQAIAYLRQLASRRDKEPESARARQRLAELRSDHLAQATALCVTLKASANAGRSTEST